MESGRGKRLGQDLYDLVPLFESGAITHLLLSLSDTRSLTLLPPMAAWPVPRQGSAGHDFGLTHVSNIDVIFSVPASEHLPGNEPSPRYRNRTFVLG